MNEQLQGAVTQLIDKALTGLDKSVSFLEAEIPEFIQQLLLWYGVKSALIFVGASYVAWFALRKIHKVFSSRPTERDFDTPFWEYSSYHGRIELSDMGHLTLICMGSILLCSGTLAIASHEWLQIWLAPKVWLLEYASSIVK